MKRRGFTLIELVVVMGLLTILFALTIMAPINNFEKELIVTESQIETIIYNAKINSENLLTNMYLKIDDKEIILSYENDVELNRIEYNDFFEISFENTSDDKRLEIMNGSFKKVDNSKPIQIKIISKKENIEYIYSLGLNGNLIKE